MKRRAALLRLAVLPLATGATGCSSLTSLDFGRRALPAGPRPFDPATDTLAVPLPEPESATRMEPLAAPELRAHVTALVTRQFFVHARFAPTQPPPDAATRLALVREVLRRGQTGPVAGGVPVVIAGYAHLREFSQLQGHVVRAESAIVWPHAHQASLLSKAFAGTGSQAQALAQLLPAVAANRPAVVRLYRQHALRYARSLLVFGVEDGKDTASFAAYDPLRPGKPVQLTYDRGTRRFAVSDDDTASGPALGVEVVL